MSHDINTIFRTFLPGNTTPADKPIFDAVFYSALYPDLASAGIRTPKSLQDHFISMGRQEGRWGNLQEWLMAHELPGDLFPTIPNWVELAKLNKLDGENEKIVTLLLDNIQNPKENGFIFSPDLNEQVRFLAAIAMLSSDRGQKTQAAHFARQALAYQSSVTIEELDKLSSLVSISDYDDDFYASFYPDLQEAEITDNTSRLNHFINYGLEEKRHYNIPCWLNENGFAPNLLGASAKLSDIVERTSSYGCPMTGAEVLKTLLGHGTGRAWLSDTAEKNAKIYLAAALAQQERSEAGAHVQNLLMIACSFDPSNAKVLLELGKCHNLQGQYRIAIQFFEQSLEDGSLDKNDVIPHLTCAWRALGEVEEAYTVFEQHLLSLRTNGALVGQIDDFCNEIWKNAEEETYHSIVTNKRAELITRTDKAIQRQYRLRLLAAGITQDPEKLSHLKTDNILIVGDFFVPQCKRYRIDQKVEQLTATGATVKTIDWTQLEKHMDELCFHDVVIFYRVPAQPNVIKAIAQVNIARRLSIYEIDDLLFDEIYPPTIDTYGGAVSSSDYTGLVRGMSLFHSAAKLCRVGLASTIPLQERLASLTQSKQCLLHRNGFDSLNAQCHVRPTLNESDHINVFYGSGTKAHNNDFIELALPAILKVMERNRHVRLIIAGYLELPKSVVEAFKDRIINLPITHDVSVYYSYLQLADINLAVLKSDLVTDCKSELKWFEAAWFGIPSIVSRTQNYLDVVRDGIDAQIADTPDEWEDALNKLIADSELRRNMGETARNRVLNDYSVDNLGRKLQASLEDCVHKLPKRTRSKYKIAMVNVFYFPQSIGGATRVFESNIKYCRQQHGETFEPVIFCANAFEGKPHEVSVETHEGMRVYRANTLFRPNMDWKPKDTEMGSLFRRFLETERPDCIHFHCIQRLTASVVEVTREMGIPYVVTLHDAWWFSDHQFLVDEAGKVYPEGHPGTEWITHACPPEGATKEQSLSRLSYLRDLLNDAERIFTVSEGFAHICRKNGFPQIEVCANGIAADIDWQNKDTRNKKRVVGAHIGGMSAHKGYDFLRDAVTRQQPKNMEFIVVDHGRPEGWERQSFWGDVPVKFVGRLSQQSITNLYAQTDVLFAPSIWPESFGLVTREAAACGCWVVASNLGAIGEDVTDGINGFVISPTEEEIRKVIKTIDANPARYKDLAQFDKPRSADVQSEEMLTVYTEILSQRN